MQPLLVEELVRDRLDEIGRLSAEHYRRERAARRLARLRTRSRRVALLHLLGAWFTR